MFSQPVRNCREHYASHLGPIYEWMIGNSDAALPSMDFYWDSIAEHFGPNLMGGGHGVQSVSFLRRGYRDEEKFGRHVVHCMKDELPEEPDTERIQTDQYESLSLLEGSQQHVTRTGTT